MSITISRDKNDWVGTVSQDHYSLVVRSEELFPVLVTLGAYTNFDESDPLLVLSNAVTHLPTIKRVTSDDEGYDDWGRSLAVRWACYDVDGKTIGDLFSTVGSAVLWLTGRDKEECNDD